MSSRYTRTALRQLAPYAPGFQASEDEGWVKLNTNESPWPPSPRVLEALQWAIQKDLRLYPRLQSLPTRKAIAHHFGIDHSQVLIGNGADEILGLCFRAFANPGDRVSFVHPSYPMLDPLCAIHEVHAARFHVTDAWDTPSDFAQDGSPLKFFVNPNSPMGTWCEPSVVQSIVQASPGVVIVDEAYADFAPSDCAGLVGPQHPNLLVIRTFSKAYALAGLRVGYVIGPPDLIAALDQVRDPYNVDRLACVAAIAAIEDRDYHERLVRFVLAERTWLSERLSSMGFMVLPSHANFVFARPPSPLRAKTMIQDLRAMKILVRHYDWNPIADWLRISVGNREEHERLLDAINTLLEEAE